jgi:hypothetical protein
MIFGFSILATAILLSCVAAYYSVAGLTAIFSAATIPVIIMGGSLELGKIVATVWLHNNWHRMGLAFKAYLVPAVAFLMVLTSMGIFGYLSKAHSDQSLVSGDAVAKVAIYDEKIKISRENIDSDRRALKQLDDAVDQVMGRSADEKGADKAVAVRRSQGKERARLIADIEAEQKKITSLNEERAPLAAEFRKVESEVGPIKYIAALVYSDNPDSNVLERAVRLVIIMIVLVFDPLALTLILAANKQFEWARQGTGGFVHDKPKYEPDDGPLTPDQVDQINKSATANIADAILQAGVTNSTPADNVPVAELPNDVDTCFKCGTALMYAPGIGPFCPNQECDVADNTSGSDPIEFITAATEPRVEYQFLDEHHEPDYESELYASDIVLMSQFDNAQDTDEDFEDSYGDDEIKAAIRQWKDANPNDTIKNQRYKLMRGEIDQLPWMGLIADNAVGKESRNGFGISFPDAPSKGDTFVRVDIMPSVLYKFNGSNWIAVDKNLSGSYAYDLAYIEHLIDKISTGEYDPDLLSDSEHEQVANYLETKQSQ